MKTNLKEMSLCLASLQRKTIFVRVLTRFLNTISTSFYTLLLKAVLNLFLVTPAISIFVEISEDRLLKAALYF